MKFQIKHCNEIDSTKWNQRIAIQRSEIYNVYEYINLATNNAWYGIIWGDYEKLLPIYHKKKFGLIPYICMPFFCQKWDARFLSNNDIQEALDYLKKRNYIVDLRLLVSDNILMQGEERINYILDKNNRTYEEAYSSYHTLLKKNLAKSKVEIVENDDPNETLLFLAQNEGFRKYVKGDAFRAFEQLTSIEKLKGTILTARIDGRIEGVLLAPVWENTAYLLYPYVSEIGRKNQSMSVLIDHLVKNPRLQSINFEGSMIPSIANFYKQFGVKEQKYYEIRVKSKIFNVI